MSHDTHHVKADSRPGSSFTSSIWFMLILAFLFISAINFIGVMSKDDGGHGEKAHGTEHAAPAHQEAGHEAPAHGEGDGHAH